MAPKKQLQDVVLTEGQQREVDECSRLKQRAIDLGVRGGATLLPPSRVQASRGYYTYTRPPFAQVISKKVVHTAQQVALSRGGCARIPPRMPERRRPRARARPCASNHPRVR